MNMTPEQQTAIHTALSADLATLATDRLIELCLLYRAQPTAFDTFPAALEAEITRRFDAQTLAEDDTLYSVLTHFANQFKSAIPHFHQALMEMAGTVNRDIWFTDHAELFKSAIANEDVASWLTQKAQNGILNKILRNRIALGFVAQSSVAATAILSEETTVALWKDAPDLWDIWPRHEAGMAVVAKSAELTQHIINTPAALAAASASSVAVQALMASTTARLVLLTSASAMAAVAASSTAMAAVAASSTAMAAVAASSTAMAAVVDTAVGRAALMTANTVLQGLRTTLYDTIKTTWVKVRHVEMREGNGGVRYYSGNAAFAGPENALVFACLGAYSIGHTSGRCLLEHPDGSTAAEGGYRPPPQNMDAVDAVSFAGAKLKQTVAHAGAYVEVWKPA